MLTDTVHSCDGSMLRSWVWSPGRKELGGAAHGWGGNRLWMLSKTCWAEGDFHFSLFFSLQKLKWYKANFRNTSIRLRVTGNSASRCLAILVQHQDWGRVGPVRAAAGQLAESWGARVAVAGSVSPALPSCLGERSSSSQGALGAVLSLFTSTPHL